MNFQVYGAPGGMLFNDPQAMLKQQQFQQMIQQHQLQQQQQMLQAALQHAQQAGLTSGIPPSGAMSAAGYVSPHFSFKNIL